MENESISIANPDKHQLNAGTKISIALISIGLLVFAASFLNVRLNAAYFLPISSALIIFGIIFYSRSIYLNKPAGIKNDGVWFRSLTARGVVGWCF
jgi:hypothetical protein